MGRGQGQVAVVSKRNVYPLTEETVSETKEFFTLRWQEWLESRNRPNSGDLRGACVFATAFSRFIFGGKVVGNWHHLRLLVGQDYVDLTEGIGVKEQAKEHDIEYTRLEQELPGYRRSRFFQGTDPDPFLHQPAFISSYEFKEVWQSVQPQAKEWAQQFLDAH